MSLSISQHFHSRDTGVDRGAWVAEGAETVRPHERGGAARGDEEADGA